MRIRCARAACDMAMELATDDPPMGGSAVPVTVVAPTDEAELKLGAGMALLAELVILLLVLLPHPMVLWLVALLLLLLMELLAPPTLAAAPLPGVLLGELPSLELV